MRDDDPLWRPLRIGSLTLDRRVFMAPMAGITTAPFRHSVRRWGAGLVFTEMISACGIRYRNRRTLDYLASTPDEHPIGFQLFGAEPAVVAAAALECVAAGADLIDLNMACPVRKVVKTGAGAALLDDRPRAVRMVAAVVAEVGPAVPVTVKIRAGLRAGDELGRRLAPEFVAAGASAVCLHPRSAAQLYHGVADHALTRGLAAELPIPVIASGDMESRAVALDLVEAGVAGVMLARHAVGRPWLFDEVLCASQAPSASQRASEVRLFAEEVMQALGERAVGHLRQFWPRFRRSGCLSKEVSLALMRANDIAGLRALLATDFW
ncbi:MAG: tRNA-dihydrouridine synthase family protein [Thermoleophilia bacterium]